MATISKKYLNIIRKMCTINYKGKMKNRHLSVAIKNGNIITSFKHNYLKNYVLGKMRGSLHAEMSVIQELLNIYAPSVGGSKNYFPWFISDDSNSFNSKRKQIVTSTDFKKLKKKLKNISIIVIRLCPKNPNKLLMSKPCMDCIETLKLMNIKNICYSTGNPINPFMVEKIKNIKSVHKCKMSRILNSS